jgi:hypothetical protein
MSWKKIGGIDKVPTTHIQSTYENFPTAVGTNDSQLRINANIIKIGTLTFEDDQINGIWFKGLASSQPSSSDFSERNPFTSIEEKFYVPDGTIGSSGYDSNMGDAEMLLFKGNDPHPLINTISINPFNSAFNRDELNNGKKGDRIRFKAPTIQFDTYDHTIDIEDDSKFALRFKDTPSVIIDGKGRMGISTMYPGQKLDIHGKLNLQSHTPSTHPTRDTKAEENIYISNHSDPDPNANGKSNIGIGRGIFKMENFQGESNIAIGHHAQTNISTGIQNISLGNQSLFSSQDATYQTVIGHGSVRNIAHSLHTLAIGFNSIGGSESSTSYTVENVIAIGDNAMELSEPDSDNKVYSIIAIGKESGYRQKGKHNVLAGNRSGYSLRGDYNTAIGEDALYIGATNTAVNESTAVGYNSMRNVLTNTTNNTAVGVAAMQTIGDSTNTQDISNNTAVGHNALFHVNGSNNNAIGVMSLAACQGDSNVSIGVYANRFNKGDFNTSVGNYSLGSASANNQSRTYNIGIGYNAGFDNQGNNNVFIGGESNCTIGNGVFSNSVALGHQAKVSASNVIVFGDSSNSNIRLGMGTNAPTHLLDLHNHTDNNVGIQVRGKSSAVSYLHLTHQRDDDSATIDSFVMESRRGTDAHDKTFPTHYNTNTSPTKTMKSILGFNKNGTTIPALTVESQGIAVTEVSDNGKITLARVGVNKYTNLNAELDIVGNAFVSDNARVGGHLFVGDVFDTTDILTNVFDNGISKNYVRNSTLFINRVDVSGAYGDSNLNVKDDVRFHADNFVSGQSRFGTLASIESPFDGSGARTVNVFNDVTGERYSVVSGQSMLVQKSVDICDNLMVEDYVAVGKPIANILRNDTRDQNTLFKVDISGDGHLSNVVVDHLTHSFDVDVCNNLTASNSYMYNEHIYYPQSDVLFKGRVRSEMGLETSHIYSLDMSNNPLGATTNQLHIYHTPYVYGDLSTNDLSLSGVVVGGDHIHSSQILQVRSKSDGHDISQNANVMLFTSQISENTTDNFTQMMVGSRADINTPMKGQNMIAITHPLHIYSYDERDKIKSSHEDSQFIFDTSGRLTIGSKTLKYTDENSDTQPFIFSQGLLEFEDARIKLDVSGQSIFRDDAHFHKNVTMDDGTIMIVDTLQAKTLIYDRSATLFTVMNKLGVGKENVLNSDVIMDVSGNVDIAGTISVENIRVADLLEAVHIGERQLDNSISDRNEVVIRNADLIVDHGNSTGNDFFVKRDMAIIDHTLDICGGDINIRKNTSTGTRGNLVVEGDADVQGTLTTSSLTFVGDSQGLFNLSTGLSITTNATTLIQMTHVDSNTDNTVNHTFTSTGATLAGEVHMDDVQISNQMDVSNIITEHITVKGELNIPEGGSVEILGDVTVSGKLIADENSDVSFNTTCKAKTFDGFGMTPIGGIIMWSADNIDELPENWRICDPNYYIRNLGANKGIDPSYNAVFDENNNFNHPFNIYTQNEKSNITINNIRIPDLTSVFLQQDPS